MSVIRCRSGETANDYKAYLNTFHWKELRAEVLKRCGYVCMECKHKQKPQNMNVHHLHYKTVGNESFADLLPVCQPCHEKLHKIQSVRQLKDKKTGKRPKPKKKKLSKNEMKASIFIEENFEHVAAVIMNAPLSSDFKMLQRHIINKIGLQGYRSIKRNPEMLKVFKKRKKMITTHNNPNKSDRF